MNPPRPPAFPSASSSADRLLAAAGQAIRAGRFAEAIGPMVQAATMLPDNARIRNDLGQLYLQIGRPDYAVTALRSAIALDPRYAIAYSRLGMALQMQGDVPAAIEAFEQAVTLQPSLAEAHYHLASLHREEGRLDQALARYRDAARTATDRSARQLAQARAFILDAQEDEAEDVLRRLIKRHPELAEAQGLLGDILSGKGRFDEAVKCYDAVLASSPHAAGVYYERVRCRRIAPDDSALLGVMDAVLERQDLEPQTRVKVLLARGKAFDDLGQYDRAMAAWDAASAARAPLVRFDIAGFETWVESIVAAFSPDIFVNYAGAGSDDRTPVLILGMPRSGTTLCEQIVSSHPDAAGAGELSFWSRRSAMARQLGPLSQTFIADAAKDYLKLLREISPDALRISDKDPWNFFSIGLIHLAFPRAAIIHCRRNPIDTALSIHQTHFAPWRAFPTGGEELVRYIRAYRRLMAHWRNVLPPGRMLEIDYETLTASPDNEIRKIVEYIGLEWNDACLHPENNTRSVQTPSRWQVRRPINAESVERWRRYEPWLGALAALIER
jgi:tetratricopeptide (TPR) repeat protein